MKKLSGRFTKTATGYERCDWPEKPNSKNSNGRRLERRADRTGAIERKADQPHFGACTRRVSSGGPFELTGGGGSANAVTSKRIELTMRARNRCSISG